MPLNDLSNVHECFKHRNIHSDNKIQVQVVFFSTVRTTCSNSEKKKNRKHVIPFDIRQVNFKNVNVLKKRENTSSWIFNQLTVCSNNRSNNLDVVYKRFLFISCVFKYWLIGMEKKSCVESALHVQLRWDWRRWLRNSSQSKHIRHNSIARKNSPDTAYKLYK